MRLRTAGNAIPSGREDADRILIGHNDYCGVFGKSNLILSVPGKDDPGGRGELGWYCINIQPTDVAHTTFRQTLVKVVRNTIEPRGCSIYLMADAYGGYSYFFSPAAARAFAQFIRDWEGFGCSEPHNLDEMEIVL